MNTPATPSPEQLRHAAGRLVSALAAHDVHFYAGVPLRIKHGPALGAFAILDTQPRDIGDNELQLLAGMAEQLMKDARVTLANEARSHRAKKTRRGERLWGEKGEKGDRAKDDQDSQGHPDDRADRSDRNARSDPSDIEAQPGSH